MKLLTALASIVSVVALTAAPAVAVTNETTPREFHPRISSERDSRSHSAPVVVRSLTDHPGRARAVTETQKAEIRAVLDRLDGNTKFICTGARLAGQPEAMNRVVRLRAKLVCDYAKSLRPDLSYWYQTKVTEHRKFNGRVIVVSK